MKSGEKLTFGSVGSGRAGSLCPASLTEPLAAVSRGQGHLYCRLADVGLASREQATLAALTGEVLKTSEFKGELFSIPFDNPAPTDLASRSERSPNSIAMSKK